MEGVTYSSELSSVSLLGNEEVAASMTVLGAATLGFVAVLSFLELVLVAGVVGLRFLSANNPFVSSVIEIISGCGCSDFLARLNVLLTDLPLGFLPIWVSSASTVIVEGMLFDGCVVEA